MTWCQKDFPFSNDFFSHEVIHLGLATWDPLWISLPSNRPSLAPGEMIEVIQQTANSGGGQTRITLHCLGHSMGGLIVRGALPILMEKLNNVDLG